jgi:hypothetical protein
MIKTQDGVVRRVEGIDELIPEDYPLERRSYEWTTLPEVKKRLRGHVIIQEEELALEEAKKEREGLVLWTDGARKEDEWVGCAVVWKEDRWKKRRVHLCRQKEAFDAKMYAMSEAVRIAEEISEEREVRRVTVITDSQATLRRIQLDEHQQKTSPSGRNGSVRVDALRQSRQRHPGGGLLRARRQYHASRCISPSDRRFFSLCRSPILNKHPGVVANCDHTLE